MTGKRGRQKLLGVASDRVRDVSEQVYRDQIGEEGVARMLKKDQDQGQKIRERAGCYDRLTRIYLRVLEVE